MASTDQIQKIQDELAIRDLVARFANSCSPPNYEAFSKLWLPDIVSLPIWTLSKPFPMSKTGVEPITKMLKELIEERDVFVQLVHSGVVDLDGDRATGRWILREVARGPGDIYYNNFAVYEDKMTKVNGQWYFAERSYKYMFLDSSPFPGEVFPLL